MEKKIANIITYYDLSDEWQKVAFDNLDYHAYEALYLEPRKDHKTDEHILWDLTECTLVKGIYGSFVYNAIIVVSNNTAMLLYIDNNEATYIVV